MDTMEVNKIGAAVLVAGIAFFISGMIGDILVHPTPPKEPALKIEGAPAATGGGEPKEEALPPIAPLLAKADPAKGETLAKKLCASCHTFDQGGKAGVGPNLYGVLGAPHGHMEGFNYSAALKGKQGPWSYEELNAWLHKPSSYAPGTRMAFAGINSAQDRADLIDYLHTLSPNPLPLPEPTATPAAAPAGQAAPQAGAAGGGTPSSSEGSATQQKATTTSTQPSQEGGAAGAGSPTPDASSR
jgi:cytochrome c